MTKVMIDPGVCGFKTHVEAESDDGMTVQISVQTGCPSFNEMFEELGDTFDSFELCLAKPGTGPLFEYAQEHFPVHNSCPVFAGILKAVEVECNLALPRNTSMVFED